MSQNHQIMIEKRTNDNKKYLKKTRKNETRKNPKGRNRKGQ